MLISQTKPPYTPTRVFLEKKQNGGILKNASPLRSKMYIAKSTSRRQTYGPSTRHDPEKW